jgi:hypothetical protein
MAPAVHAVPELLHTFEVVPTHLVAPGEQMPVQTPPAQA